MHFVAWQMLTGDRAKYLGLIFAIAFSTFLMSHQVSIFCGLMSRTASQIDDVRDASIWVMDAKTLYLDEVKALTDQDLYRIRGISGVEWAVPLFKGASRAKGPDGHFRAVILMGHDDSTLTGIPRRIVHGDITRLREPESIAIDQVGYEFFFPGQPYQLNRSLDLNDRTVRIVAIVDSNAPFVNLPVVYTRYTQALNFVGRERNQMSFVLAKAIPGLPEGELTGRIADRTGLKALTSSQFGWETIWYYMEHTGIPINFGITVIIALIVGTVVAGQTFYLFTIENLKQFGALKAIGVSDLRIVGMILMQALIVGAIGYGLGISMTAIFFETTQSNLDLRGFRLLPIVMQGTAATVFLIVFLASAFSVRRVIVLEPAVVFRG
ncbi:MAG: ABC transporter permease [Bryobacter sp.]|jgi:putative ABC transport system permease protein|nr:ABC transporter permease [Bryobacter sp. CoA8 C33]